MQLEIDEFQEVIEKTADDRGRVTLGKEYAGQTVEIVVVVA